MLSKINNDFRLSEICERYAVSGEQSVITVYDDKKHRAL